MTSTTAIQPSDFSNSMTDANRNRWTPGKMRHVIDALDGQRVMVTVDTQTGFTLIGAVLIGITQPINSGWCVVVKTDMSERPTAYRMADCGVIIPMEEQRPVCGTKWMALDSHRKECSAAIRIAQKQRPDCDYGKWSAFPDAYSITWTYEPQRGPEGTNEAFSPFNRENGEMEWGTGKPRSACGTLTLEDLAVFAA